MKINAPLVILLGASFTVACNGALEVDDSANAQGASTAAAPDAAPDAVPDAAMSAASSGCQGGGPHQYWNNGDGGVPGTMIARCASVVIDGKTCAVALDNVGLDLGLDGHGWTVNARVDECFGGAILTISGVDDAAYPQTKVEPFLSEASAWLATNEDSTDDAGAGVGAFSTNPSGSSRVEQGPTATSMGVGNVSVIKGIAHVVATGGASRDVAFDFSF